MRVFVTGSEGYIGCLLCRLLEKEGHRVHGIDSGFFRCNLLEGDYGESAVQAGQDSRELSAGALAGFDAMVHLAELSNDPLGQLNPLVTHEINHWASVRLARICQKAGVKRFVYSSSCSVYGRAGSEVKDESSPVDPRTTYAHCKVLVERDVSALADRDFTTTFLRNATAYGVSPSMRFDTVVNDLAGQAWATGQINLLSDGSPWRPLVHVDDICRAIACVLNAPREAVHNQVFNVGSTEENFRVRDIAKMVAETFPEADVTTGSSNGDSRSYRVSFSKIASRLPGYTSRWSLRAGLQDLKRCFREVGLGEKEFQYRPYTRLRQLRYLLEKGLVDKRLFWTNREYSS
jgi:nucleoside-diphosphate-sugar epimerase